MITFKTATPNDIGAICGIARKTWFITYKAILSKEQLDYMFEMMYSKTALKHQLIDKKQVFYIAYISDEPLGYVSIEKQNDDLYHLHKLYVLPDCQSKGIGKALIKEAFDYARKTSKRKKCAVELNVNRHNKAFDFYIKMGMHINREGDFDIGNGFFMNDYIMRIDLL